MNQHKKMNFLHHYMFFEEDDCNLSSLVWVLIRCHMVSLICFYAFIRSISTTIKKTCHRKMCKYSK